jgi:hypothetical protein
MKKIIFFGLVFSFVIFIHSAFADSLYLKNGTKLDGTVLEETPDGVTFEVYGGKVKFLHSEIDRIEKNSLNSTPAPVTTAVPQPSTSSSSSQEKNIQAPNKQLPTERVAVPSQNKSKPKSEYMSRVQGMYDGAEAELARLKAAKVPEAKPIQVPEIRNIIGSVQGASHIVPSSLTGAGWDRVRAHLENLTNPKPIAPADLEGNALYIFFGHALVVLFFSALVIFTYIWVLGNRSISYWRAVWFLFKFNFVTNITLAVSAATLVPKPGTVPTFFSPGGPGLFILLGFIVLSIFYWFAQRDFDSGFFKTTGLLVLVILAHIIASCGAAYFGLA